MNFTKSCRYIAIIGLVVSVMTCGAIAAENAATQVTPEIDVSIGKARVQSLQELQYTIFLTDVRKLLVQEMKSAKIDILSLDFTLTNSPRITIVPKFESIVKTPSVKLDEYVTLAYGLTYFGSASDTRKRLENKIETARKKLVMLQKTDDAMNTAWEKLNDSIGKVAEEGDSRISACYDSNHISFSDKKYVFNSIDDAKVWANECLDTLKAYNSDTTNNPLGNANKKIDEFTESLLTANQQIDNERANLEERLRNLDQQTNLANQRALGQIEQDFLSRKVIFFVGLPIFALVVLMLLIIPWFYPSELQKEFFQSPLILNIFTVFILAVAIIILAVTKSLEPQAVSTLLAGIAGYVLGSSAKKT